MEPFPYLCHFTIFPLTKFSFFKGWLPLVLNFKKPNWKMFGLKTNCLDWIARETFNRRKVKVKNDLYQLTIPFNRKVDSTIPSISLSWHTSIKPSGILSILVSLELNTFPCSHMIMSLICLDSLYHGESQGGKSKLPERNDSINLRQRALLASQWEVMGVHGKSVGGQ